MLSSYFKMKTKTSDFEDNLKSIFQKYSGKKVIIYGAADGFFELNKKYNFNEKFDIVAIADKKFEDKNTGSYKGFKSIEPYKIIDLEYDIILITNESSTKIVKYLNCTLGIDEEKISAIFKEDIEDEPINYNYLEKFHFGNYLEKLKKRLKGKSVVIFGTDNFFELIQKYYNLDNINIIGITDNLIAINNDSKKIFNYKIYTPDELKELKPDCVVVASKFYMNDIEKLYYHILKDTKIKIMPIYKKPFFDLLKEVWK